MADTDIHAKLQALIDDALDHYDQIRQEAVLAEARARSHSISQVLRQPKRLSIAPEGEDSGLDR